jgi:RNA polymerase sigma factor (sigma-70 family)
MRKLQNIRVLSDSSTTIAKHERHLVQLIEIENLSPTISEEELIELLSNTINKLPAKNKQVILLHYFQNKSIEDIKAIIGKSESTVRSHLNYGIFFLKKYFTHKLKTHA